MDTTFPLEVVSLRQFWGILGERDNQPITVRGEEQIPQRPLN